MNFCSINVGSIDSLCGSRRGVILQGLIAELRHERPTGGSGTPHEQFSKPTRFPKQDRQTDDTKIKYTELEAILVKVKLDKYTGQDRQDNKQDDTLVFITNVEVNADQPTVNIENLVVNSKLVL